MGGIRRPRDKGNRMMKRLKNAIALLLCTVLLSGCQIISAGDDLLQTPKPSQEYTLLHNKLEQIMGTTMT